MPDRCLFVGLFWLFSAIYWPAAGQEDVSARLRAVYPLGEYCLFVPPPAWEGFVELQEHEMALLRADREVTKRALVGMSRSLEAPVLALEPAVGLTEEIIEGGGSGLGDTVRANFHRFAQIWRQLRSAALEDAEQQPIDVFHSLQAACPRRAIMVLVRRNDRHIVANVISLITGYRLASLELRG